LYAFLDSLLCTQSNCILNQILTFLELNVTNKSNNCCPIKFCSNRKYVYHTQLCKLTKRNIWQFYMFSPFQTKWIILRFHAVLDASKSKKSQELYTLLRTILNSLGRIYSCQILFGRGASQLTYRSCRCVHHILFFDNLIERCCSNYNKDLKCIFYKMQSRLYNDSSYFDLENTLCPRKLINVSGQLS
jgi:hypothetical protein